MRWEDPSPVSEDGTVLWHAALAGLQLHCEATYIKPYVGRLRAWAQRGTGPLVLDEVLCLRHDQREPVASADTALWLARCEAAGQAHTQMLAVASRP
jgi:hypothetical protein